MCTKRTSSRSAKSFAAGVQGPLKGPGSSGILDALWCNLSLIFLGALYPTDLFTFIFIIHLLFIFLSHTTWAREKSNSSGRAGDFGKFASKRESWTLCHPCNILLGEKRGGGGLDKRSPPPIWGCAANMTWVEVTSELWWILSMT